MEEQLLWIGLGNMGRGMCKNLASKGNLSKPLMVYNRTLSKAEEFAKTLDAPINVTANVSEAISSATTIFFCVSDDAAVSSVIESILQSGADLTGKVIVDCSTVHPDTTKQSAEKIEKKGAAFVANPVFGAPAMADAGQLICVLAGKKDAVARVKPYCAGVVGKANIDLSTEEGDVGKASLLKVLGNTMILRMVESIAESMVVAEKSSLGTEPLAEVINLLFSGPYSAYTNRMLTGDYYKREEPLFAVDLARKDARHAMQLAESNGARMRGVEMSDEYLRMVKEHSGEKGDIAGIYGAVRKEAGLKFENE